MVTNEALLSLIDQYPAGFGPAVHWIRSEFQAGKRYVLLKQPLKWLTQRCVIHEDEASRALAAATPSVRSPGRRPVSQSASAAPRVWGIEFSKPWDEIAQLSPEERIPLAMVVSRPDGSPMAPVPLDEVPEARAQFLGEA